MPLELQCEHFPLTQEEVSLLWKETHERMNIPDDDVSLSCVSVEEIQRLNREYRDTDAPTNILTFSYKEENDHDVVISLHVAEKEASERKVSLRDYIALLVVHALLHVCGEDHEKSDDDATRTSELEREILLACGFVPEALSDVY